MSTAEQFNLSLGVALKKEGMDLAATNRAKLLELARKIARYIAIFVRGDGMCTADDVQELMIRTGQPPLGNAAGSIFTKGEWEKVGDINSRRITNHAHRNYVWRLKETL